jgi:hypothetical protein
MSKKPKTSAVTKEAEPKQDDRRQVIYFSSPEERNQFRQDARRSTVDRNVSSFTRFLYRRWQREEKAKEAHHANQA